jgi:hypothetical protein
MTFEEKQSFSNVLFAHKDLLTLFQEYRYMSEHPQSDYESVHERFFEEVGDVYKSLEDALVDDIPLKEPLDTVITHSHLIEVEVRNALKGR